MQDVTADEFESLGTLQLALERLFEILGEAANRIPRDVQGKYTNIPWGDIIKMRNVIAHSYDIIISHILYASVKQGIPPLRMALIDTLNLIAQENPD